METIKKSRDMIKPGFLYGQKYSVFNNNTDHDDDDDDDKKADTNTNIYPTDQHKNPNKNNKYNRKKRR